MKAISKIDTLFERGADFTVDTNKLSRPVLSTIAGWLVTEKVNGTSMRIGWFRDIDEIYNLGPNVFKMDLVIDVPEVGPYPIYGFVAGKTDEASIPPGLLMSCREIVEHSASEALSIMDEFGLDALTLYGEGYGGNIHKGAKYRPDPGFIAFDVRINNRLYLAEEAVTKTCHRLAVDRVPLLAYGTGPNDFGPRSLYNLTKAPKHAVTPVAATQDEFVRSTWPLMHIVETVQDGFPSFCSIEEQPAEGIVARTVEPLYDNRGQRLIVKLKARDFRKGKR